VDCEPLVGTRKIFLAGSCSNLKITIFLIKIIPKEWGKQFGTGLDFAVNY